jgi:DNA mismatch endonuclease (patch repair protein)
MSDVHNPESRRRNMQAIRQKNTKPEVLLRQLLHARGFRFRLHVKHLPGTPDIVLSKYRAAVFVHGCFWHGHDCYLFRLPQTRRDFWETKINANRTRDLQTMHALREAGWRVLIVWECGVKGRLRHPQDILLNEIEAWLRSPSDAEHFTFAELKCTESCQSR